MTTTKANRSGARKVKRSCVLRIILACFLIQLTTTIPGYGLAQSKKPTGEDPPSNEEFLRESIKSLIVHTFDDFPKAYPRFVLLKADQEHPANWLLEDELIRYLLLSKYQVGLRSNEASEELPESSSLFYRIIEMSLDYPKIERKGFFGKRLVTRKASLNLSFRLEDNASGKVLWSKRGKDEKSDLIKKGMAGSLNNEIYPFLSPSLPEDTQSRFIEPALVVAVVGGLIYLFFANR